MVTFVVEADDPSVQSACQQRRTQVLADEVRLLGRGHEHAGRVVGVFRFILWSKGCDRDAVCFHPFQVEHPVSGVRVIVCRQQVPALKSWLVFIQTGAVQGEAMICSVG